MDIVTFKCLITDRVHLVRYEDIALNPKEASDELLNFLDLRESSYINNFIRSHTNANITSSGKAKVAYSTVRNSTKEAFQWRNNITPEDILEVQTKCDEPMDILGYNPMTNVPEDIFNESYELMGPLFGEDI